MTKPFGMREAIIPALSLFASTGTLVCCALPALFISLGMGAALAGMVSSIPQVIWLSENKLAVFGFAAAMLAIAGTALYRARNLPCPVDPVQARICARLRKSSLIIYWISLTLFLTGGFFAFIAPELFF